jgi:hypothetical protein
MSALKIAASLRRLLHSAIAHSTREQAANLRFPVTASNRTDKGQANRPNEARRPKGRPRNLPKRKAIHWSSRCAVHLGINDALKTIHRHVPFEAQKPHPRRCS